MAKAKKAAATKEKPTTDIESVAASITGADDKGAALEQLQALMASGGLQALLDQAGLKVVAKTAGTKKDSRLARVREWASGLKTKLAGEDLATVKSLTDAVGKAEFPSEPGDLTQQQIDDMMEEALTIRPSQDILKGRYEAIKAAAFAAMTARTGDELAAAALVSAKHGHKFVKQVRETKATANLDALEALVTAEVWKAITVATRKVDESKLAEAVAKGVFPVELLEQVTTPAGKSASFYVREIKDGDEVL